MTTGTKPIGPVIEALPPRLVRSRETGRNMPTNGYNPAHMDLTPFGVPKHYLNARVSDFGDDVRNQLVGITVGGRDGLGYFITGGVGAGKTRLAVGILRVWIAYRMGDVAMRYGRVTVSARFVSAPDLLGELGKVDFKDKENIIKRHKEYKLLVLDDYGSEHVTGWSQSEIRRVITGRINASMPDDTLPTIVTSNLSLNQIDTIDARVSSRLNTFGKVEAGNVDRRNLK